MRARLSTVPAAARRRLTLLALALAGTFAAAVVVLPHDAAGLARLAALPTPVLAGAVVLAWTLLTPALVSGTLMAAATGALLGATLGSVAAFLLARRLGRDPVEALTGPRVARVRERLERRPLLTIALARLAPGCPATILSYAAGLTRIRLRHFAVGIVIGGAPRVVAYTALGGAARHALWPALAAAALLAVLGVAVTVVARRRRSAAAA